MPRYNRRVACVRVALLLIATLAFTGPSMHQWFSGPIDFDPEAYLSDPASWHSRYVKVQGRVGEYSMELVSVDSNWRRPLRRTHTQYSLLTLEGVAGPYAMWCTRPSGPSDALQATRSMTGMLQIENPLIQRNLHRIPLPDVRLLPVELNVDASPRPVAVVGLFVSGVWLAVLAYLGLVRERELEGAGEEPLLVLRAPWQPALSSAALVLVLAVAGASAIGWATGARVGMPVAALLALTLLWQARRDRYILTQQHLIVSTANDATSCALRDIVWIYREDGVDGASEAIAVFLKGGRRFLLEMTGCSGGELFLRRLAELSPHAVVGFTPALESAYYERFASEQWNDAVRLTREAEGFSAHVGPAEETYTAIGRNRCAAFNWRLGMALLGTCTLLAAAEWAASAYETRCLPPLQVVRDPMLGYIPFREGRTEFERASEQCAIPGRHVIVVGSAQTDQPPAPTSADIFCSRLQERLQAAVPGPPVQVVNGCVEFYSLAKSARRAHLLAELCRPDLVVFLVFHPGRESLDSLAPERPFRMQVQRLLLESALYRRVAYSMFPYQLRLEELMSDARADSNYRANLELVASRFVHRGIPVVMFNRSTRGEPSDSALESAQQALSIPSRTITDDLVRLQASHGEDMTEWLTQAVVDAVLRNGWLKTPVESPLQ